VSTPNAALVEAMSIYERASDSLDEALDGQYQAEPDSGFRVDDASKAAWALRRLAKAAEAQKAARALADERKALIDAWADAEVARHEQDRSYFESLLVGYVAERNRYDGVKTINLPGGVLRARKTPAKVEVDSAAFVAWATEAGRDDLLRIKAEPDKAKIKAASLEDGEALPHVAVDLGGNVTYTVTISERDEEER